jgi:hypothetical protein
MAVKRPSPVPTSSPSRRTLTLKLQILGAFTLPLLVLGLWLNAKGFFQSP